MKIEIKADGTWYHGSNKKFEVLREGSTITQWKYEKEEQFFDMVEKRPEDYTTKWLETVDMPIIRVDGTRAIEDNIVKIKEELTKIQA